MKPRIVGKYRDENGMGKKIMWRAKNSNGFFYPEIENSILIFNHIQGNLNAK